MFALLEAFENNLYHLRVYGPNGFFREFKGNAKDPLLEILCDYETKPASGNILTGNLQLVLSNLNEQSCTLEITDRAYKMPAIKRTLQKKGTAAARSVVLLDLSKSYGWYDFSIKLNGSGTFERRFAGRVETGRSGYSDPFMGRML